MKAVKDISRRDFLTYSGAAAAGLTLGQLLPHTVYSAPGKTKNLIFLEGESNQGFSKIGRRRTELCGGLVMAGLVTATAWKPNRDPLLALDVPSLDKKTWEVFKDGRMRTVWQLRKNVKWHDGADFTAHDYVFGWEVARNPKIDYRATDYEEKMEKLEAPDPYTLVINWKEPFAYANHLFSNNLFPLPRHILEQAYRKDPVAFNKHPYHTTQFIGLGPFKVMEWQQGMLIRMEAFDQFFLGRPKIDTITWKVIENDNSLAANIMAGQGHISTRALSEEQAFVLKDQWEAKGKGIVDFTVAGLACVGPSTISEPWFKDIRVRRALLHAIDRETMVKQLFRGVEPVAHSFVAERHEAVWPLVKNKLRYYKYDPALALQLLNEAGWKKGSDGILANARGEKLTFPYQTASDRAQEVAVQAVVIDYWKKIGVVATPKNELRRVLMDANHRNRYKGVQFDRHNLELDDFDTMWHGKNTSTEENKWINQNRTGWSGADDLIDRWTKELRVERRNQIVAEIAIRFSEELPVLPLFNYVEIVTIDKRLKNVKPRQGSGGDNATAWNAYTWDLEES